MNPPIIDALKRYCQITQTEDERKESIILLEPSNRYTQETLYLPLNQALLKKYFETQLSLIENVFPVDFIYGNSLFEYLFE